MSPFCSLSLASNPGPGPTPLAVVSRALHDSLPFFWAALSTGAIVGIVIGSLVGVAALAGLVVFLIRRRKPDAEVTKFQRFGKP